MCLSGDVGHDVKRWCGTWYRDCQKHRACREYRLSKVSQLSKILILAGIFWNIYANKFDISPWCLNTLIFSKYSKVSIILSRLILSILSTASMFAKDSILLDIDKLGRLYIFNMLDILDLYTCSFRSSFCWYTVLYFILIILSIFEF